jgi:hypothetical protein
MKTICLSEAKPASGGAAVKIAPTAVSLSSVKLHGAVPEHAPVHPIKLEPWLEFAVNVTEVPVAKAALHVSPQLMPAGALVTVPVPLPESVRVSWTVAGGKGASALNVAVTDT